MPEGRTVVFDSECRLAVYLEEYTVLSAVGQYAGLAIVYVFSFERSRPLLFQLQDTSLNHSIQGKI